MVITGSSKGLGLALAEQFLETGDAVVVSSRDKSRCEAAAADLAARFPGATVRAFPADVSVSEQAEALADFAAAELSRIDIWVNNAGAVLSLCSRLDHQNCIACQHSLWPS